MRGRLALLITLVALTVPRAWAQVPTEGWDAWVRDLTSADFQVRENAVENLVRMGPAVRTPLEAVRDTLDLEGQLRIDAVLARLEGDVSIPDPLAGTVLDFLVDQLPLDVAAERLGRAAGVPLAFGRPMAQNPAGSARSPSPGAQAIVSMDARGRTFFEILDELCRLGSCTFTPDYGSGSLFLTFVGNNLTEPVVYDGALRVALTSLSVTRQTRFVEPPFVSANLQVRINVEPGSAVMGLLAPLRDLTAEDDQGRPVTFVRSPGEQNMVSLGSHGQAQQAVALDAPDPSVKALVNLRIPMTFLVPSRIDTSELLAPEADPAGPEVGPLRLRLDARQPAQDADILTLSFLSPVTTGDVPTRSPVVWDEVRIWDQAGAPVTFGAQSVGRRRQGNRTVLTINVPRVQIARIKLRAATEYRAVQKTVTFERVPLP